MSTLEKEELSVVSGGNCENALGHRKEESSVFVEASIALQMSEMIRAFRISQIVGAVAQLEFPIDSPAVRGPPGNWLRSLAVMPERPIGSCGRKPPGLVASGPDARFMLTALGQSLRSDVPGRFGTRPSH